LNLRALRYEFCSRCNSTEMHRDLQCLECERQSGTAPVVVTRPQEKAPRRNPHLKSRPRSTDLTQAEEQVARLLASGLNQREIATHLQLHHSSVSNTVRRACRRIGVVSDWDLIRYVRAKDLRARNRVRLGRALSDPRVIAATTGEPS